MTDQTTNPIGKLPRWQQIALFVFLFFTLMVALDWVKEAYKNSQGSPRSRAIKEALYPLAERLELAQKIGDRQAVLALFEPTTKIVNEYNTLDAAKRAEVNNSPLRYCLLAAINLSDGVSEVINSGYWTSKDKYQNALDMCR